jgi:DNA modification methylase
MQIETIAVDRLIPYARNSRTHSDAQVAQIAASMREFGFTNPVLVDADYGIIAGHGRVMAARQLGLADVPCIRLGHLTEAQKRAYIIADNRLALNAGWDDAMLALEMRDLMDAGYDVGLTGFELGEIDELLASLDATPEGETDADAVPEVRPEAISKPGDVWLLGRHRIMCGDSTDAGSVALLLAGATPHLMVTDPPYGVEYDPTRTSDNPLKAGKVLNDDRADWREAWALFPGEVAYVWHASMFTHVVLESLEACGFEHRAMVVWGKDRFTLGRGHYHWQHEPAWYVVKKGATGHWSGDRSQATLWSIKAREDGGHGHGTQKPIECMKRPIENNSKPGDSVYDPFSGSGTTLIAAEQTGRRCYAMELSPQYVDVAVRRWQQFTGKRAVLESTGADFPA